MTGLKQFRERVRDAAKTFEVLEGIKTTIEGASKADDHEVRLTRMQAEMVYALIERELG